jgi:hypothetical protein
MAWRCGDVDRLAEQIDREHQEVAALGLQAVATLREDVVSHACARF